MVVNFQRVHKINRGARKLHRTSKLIIIIIKKKACPMVLHGLHLISPNHLFFPHWLDWM